MVGRLAASLSFAACLLLVTVSGASHARAQAASDDATERARALFAEGLDLADAGDWERAVHRFRRALELRDAAPVRYNLATSLARMGRLLEALEEVDRVVAMPDAEPEVRAAAEQLRTENTPRLGRLSVLVEGDAEGTHVTVDGRPWGGRPGVAAAADPGVRVVRLMRDMTELDLEEADVPEGGSTTVRLEVEGLSASHGARSTPEEASGGGSDDAWIWGVVIAVVALAAGGAVLTGVLLGDQGPQPSTGDFMPPVLEID